MEKWGDEFQQKTKYNRANLPVGPLDWSSQPELYKSYPDSKIIDLPEPMIQKNLDLMKILRQRKSVRSFSDHTLTIKKLSVLLWACTGIQRSEMGYEFRTAPSAGALYPIETYIVANNIEALDPGIYHYNIQQHALEVLNTGLYGPAVAQAALGQAMASEAPVVFIWTAIFERSRWKYRQRSYRYIYLDAGHLVQNLALTAVGLELGTCQVGALFDDELNELLGVDGADESVIYMSVVGTPL